MAEGRKKIGRPPSADPAVTVSFSMPRSEAAEMEKAIEASAAPSRSAWFREAVYRQMGRFNGRTTEVQTRFKGDK